jgi:hypothetical protein
MFLDIMGLSKLQLARAVSSEIKTTGNQLLKNTHTKAQD